MKAYEMLLDKRLSRDEKCSEEKVYFNVRGTKYETFESTLSSFPHTLLGNRAKRGKFLNKLTGEYVFDCPSHIFDAVLFFYQSKGILARSEFSPEQEYKELLFFFGITKPKISSYLYPRSEKSFCNKVWTFLEYPRKSKWSLSWAYLSFFVIIVSVATICGETLENNLPEKSVRLMTDWFKLECVYISFFSLEYLARLASAPDRKKFFFSLLGMIDLIAIMPFFVSLGGIILKKNVAHTSIAFIRILRLMQILRIIKLSRYSSGMQILGKSIQSCKKQILSLGIFFMIGVIFSSSFIYLFENMENKGFESIPATMWYVVISMTTVGYGDVVATTPLGKVSSVISILIGTVVLFHLFLPIYLMHFSIHYIEWQEKTEIEQRYIEQLQKDKLKDGEKNDLLPSENKTFSRFDFMEEIGSISSVQTPAPIARYLINRKLSNFDDTSSISSRHRSPYSNPLFQRNCDLD